MKKKCFKYFNNKETPQKLMAFVIAKSILDADKTFEELTGFCPVKCNWIGVTVNEFSN